MEGKIYNNKAIIRIDKNDEVMTSLEEFCKLNNIKVASVSGIGASDNITVAVYSKDHGDYASSTYNKDYYEINNFSGNITTPSTGTHAHIHISFSDHLGNTFGGHLKECVIAGACEIFLDIVDADLDREFNKEVGLNTLKFK